MLERVTMTPRPRWIVGVSRERPRLRLLCFPHAGGGASAFRAWGELLSSDIEVCAVQPPGREERIREAPISSLPALVGALLEHTAAVRTEPYACFGHSVGALVAFELTRALRRAGQRLPSHLFVSGSPAPQLPDTDPPLASSSDAELIGRLRRHRGTPTAVLEHAEIVDLILPTLRADLALRDGYRYTTEAPLPVPITAYGGQEDADVSQADLIAWCEQTSASFTMRAFPGGHFFVRSARAALLPDIERELGLG